MAKQRNVDLLSIRQTTGSNEDEVRYFLDGEDYPQDAIEEAIRNTVKIADACNVTIELGEIKPPKFLYQKDLTVNINI